MKSVGFAFLEPYRARWQALEPRERRVLTIGIIVLAAFLFYILLWSRMQSDLARLRVSVPKDQARLSVMRVQAMQVSQLRAQGATGRAQGGNILSVIEQTATTRGLKQSITRMEPEGANNVRLNLDSVSFNALAAWLSDLQKQNGIRVDNATLESLPAPGMVRARLLLRGMSG
jgi:general secretion pathway protein M